MTFQHTYRLATSNWAYSLYSTLTVVIIYFTTYHSIPPNSENINQLCQVLSITDGDSLIAQCGKRQHNLRLMHIDAPEITQKHWGEHAKTTLQQLVGKNIFVQFHGTDTYQRDLAIIFPSNEQKNPINLQLVEQGVVRVYSRYNPPVEYSNTMRQAKKSKIGIWQEKGLHQDPMRYRRLAY